MADADVRWLQRLENYERALATLERALSLVATRPLSELEQLGLIQTFECTHELSWLLLKDFLVDQGVSDRIYPAVLVTCKNGLHVRAKKAVFYVLYPAHSMLRPFGEK